MRRLTIAALLALMLVVGLIAGGAIAQQTDGKHHGCYWTGTSQPFRPFYYLVNGETTSCPSGYVEVDWVDD